MQAKPEVQLQSHLLVAKPVGIQCAVSHKLNINRTCIPARKPSTAVSAGMRVIAAEKQVA